MLIINYWINFFETKNIVKFAQYLIITIKLIYINPKRPTLYVC